MPGILDLPNEILSLIWRDLPLPALISTRFVSRHIYESSLPYVHYAFQKKSTPEHTRGELRRFWEFIKNDPLVRPQVRSIIVDDMCGDLSIRTLRSLTVPLLSFTPRLRKLAIPGHLKLLSSLHTSIQKGTTSLRCLQELRCVECDPIIWEILGDLPQLCLLSLTNLRLDQSIFELPAASLSIQTIFFEDCDLDSRGICAVIKSCKRLTSFQYLCSSPKRLLFGDPGKSYLDVGDIHEALLHHKNSLEELVIQDYDDGKPYDQIPKFRSFEDFTSLTRLGVDYYNIDWHLPFPPALDSVAVRQCWIGENEFGVVLGYLGKHPYLKAISVDHAVACVFFQQSRLVRKDIRLHFPARYHPSFGEFSNVIAHPLPWIGPSEHFLI